MQQTDDGMTEQAKKSHPVATDDAELWTLERRWYDGALLGHVEVLQRFAEKHRSRILEQAGNEPDEAQLTAALKSAIVKTGTLDAPSELRDQAREIKDEIWFRGERGDFDRCRIQLEWTERHAEAWRKWRLKEYLFVVDRCAHQLVRTLRPGATGTGR